VIGPEAEEPQPSSAPGFADAVTFAFGDLGSERYGFARLGVADDRVGSALAVLFAGRDCVAALARGDVEVAPGWTFQAVAGVSASVAEPLERWRVAFAGEGAGFELEFEAAAPPASVESAGVRGYEQLCHVRGTVTAGGRAAAVQCLGQRGHQWGVVWWASLASTRALGAWLPDGPSVALGAARPLRAHGHAEEARWGALLGPGEPVAIADPRWSTTYDGEGRQRRVGLELWVDQEDEAPLRACGEVVCGSTLELGALRLECAFLRWHAEGRAGAGRYDVLRRA
jgi:hypothetical protein